MLKLILASLIFASFNSFAIEDISVKIKLVKILEKMDREFGEGHDEKVISSFKSKLEKVKEHNKTSYYLNVPQLGSKYLVGVRESKRYFKDGNLSGKSTPVMKMTLKGHQLKRLVGGINSYLGNVQKDTEFEAIYESCFKVCETDEAKEYAESCYIRTQPAMGPGNFYDSNDYDFIFSRQQGLFINLDRLDSFNFMKNRISFSVYSDGKRDAYELHITLSDAEF